MASELPTHPRFEEWWVYYHGKHPDSTLYEVVRAAYYSGWHAGIAEHEIQKTIALGEQR